MVYYLLVISLDWIKKSNSLEPITIYTEEVVATKAFGFNASESPLKFNLKEEKTSSVGFPAELCKGHGSVANFKDIW